MGGKGGKNGRDKKGGHSLLTVHADSLKEKSLLKLPWII